MTVAQLTLSLRRRLFYAVLGGFASIYFLSGSLDFVLACPVGGVVGGALFLAWSPVKGRTRVQSAALAFLTILTFPILMLMLGVGHLGLYESASPLVPFPVRLLLLLTLPAVAVFVGGKRLAQRHQLATP